MNKNKATPHLYDFLLKNRPISTVDCELIIPIFAHPGSVGIKLTFYELQKSQ